jgi:transposase
MSACLFGPGYAGVLVRDGWAPYRKLLAATHQTCFAHLLRRCHGLLETAQRGAARFPHAVRRVLLAALALRDRRARGDLTGHGLRVALGRLEARTDRLLAGRVTHAPNRRLLHHLQTERAALFTCVRRPDVEATNWQAEQAIRPAVVTRKVCGGNRTPRGAATSRSSPVCSAPVHSSSAIRSRCSSTSSAARAPSWRTSGCRDRHRLPEHAPSPFIRSPIPLTAPVRR